MAESESDAAQREKLTLDRLSEQVAWYDRRSTMNRRLYQAVKILIITSAATIPVLTTAGIPHGPQIAAGLGVLIAIFQGIQQLNQYQSNWANFRMTAEALKHEKAYYVAHAGPYAKADDRVALLTERMEDLIAKETEKWFGNQAQVNNDSLRTNR
jgi:hypothetical protein